MLDEEAKAVQEVAKATGKAIEGKQLLAATNDSVLG
jgi:hypothetical protein